MKRPTKTPFSKIKKKPGTTAKPQATFKPIKKPKPKPVKEVFTKPGTKPGTGFKPGTATKPGGDNKPAKPGGILKPEAGPQKPKPDSPTILDGFKPGQFEHHIPRNQISR